MIRQLLDIIFRKCRLLIFESWNRQIFFNYYPNKILLLVKKTCILYYYFIERKFTNEYANFILSFDKFYMSVHIDLKDLMPLKCILVELLSKKMAD